jgi:hypothetical protein
MIDPHLPDKHVAKRSQIERDKAKATEFDRVNFFGSRSKYVGSPEALRRLSNKAGKPYNSPQS